MWSLLGGLEGGGEAQKRGRRLYQSRRSFSYEVSKLFHFLFSNNNKLQPLCYIVLCIPELSVIFIVLLLLYLFRIHFDLPLASFWSGF